MLLFDSVTDGGRGHRGPEKWKNESGLLGGDARRRTDWAVRNFGTPVTAVVDRRVYLPADGDRHELAYRIYYHFTLDDVRYDKSNFASNKENAAIPNAVSGRATHAYGFAHFITPQGWPAIHILVLTAFALLWNLPLYVLLHILWIGPARARRLRLRQQLGQE